MTTDLTFITNEDGKSLLERFKVLLGSNTRFVDCLVGYFYASGFYPLVENFKQTEKIRILIGISTNPTTFNAIQAAKQYELKLSQAETKDAYGQQVVHEMNTSPDDVNTEKGVHEFISWIHKNKLEIRVFPSARLHSKRYILTFNEGDVVLLQSARRAQKTHAACRGSRGGATLNPVEKLGRLHEAHL